MPLRNERQFSYLSYENLCLKNLRRRLVYTSHNQHTQVAKPFAALLWIWIWQN